ncbi:MAG: peptidase E [Planctomycetota bacterium]|nr:MAG: peptidase E [Planctomycetota bacterium]
MTSNIISIGGGGYYGPQGGPNRMLLHILKLTNKKFPNICLIPSASSNKEESIHAFTSSFNSFGAHPNYLDFYRLPTSDLEDWLMTFDAVYIAGGNTRNLLALWKAWDFDKILIKACDNGVVMSGSSAGAICWFEGGNSDYIPGQLNPIDGLGVLEGSICPHYSDTNNRRKSYLDMVEDGRLENGFGISDRAAIHYIDGKFHEALVEHEEAGVYKVEIDASNKVVETKMEAKLV